jgi:hypothetical protein
VEVVGPKGPYEHTGAGLLTWAHDQLTIAEEIMDNPGGGLLFATTAVGQVKAALGERGARSEEERHRWEPVVDILDRVEDDLVRRRFDSARTGLREALKALSAGEGAQTA